MPSNSAHRKRLVHMQCLSLVLLLAVGDSPCIKLDQFDPHIDSVEPLQVCETTVVKTFIPRAHEHLYWRYDGTSSPNT